MKLVDYWMARYVHNADDLVAMQGAILAIERKLQELGDNGAFMCGPDPHGTITTTQGSFIAVDEWALDVEHGTIGIRYIYDMVHDNHCDRRCVSERWMTCPIEWLFMPEDKYMPLKEERYKELRAQRNEAVLAAEKYKRRERYLQLRQEYEELRAEFEPEEKSNDNSEG